MITVFSANYPVDRSADEMVVTFEAFTFTASGGYTQVKLAAALLASNPDLPRLARAFVRHIAVRPLSITTASTSTRSSTSITTSTSPASETSTAMTEMSATHIAMSQATTSRSATSVMVTSATSTESSSTTIAFGTPILTWLSPTTIMTVLHYETHKDYTHQSIIVHVENIGDDASSADIVAMASSGVRSPAGTVPVVMRTVTPTTSRMVFRVTAFMVLMSDDGALEHLAETVVQNFTFDSSVFIEETTDPDIAEDRHTIATIVGGLEFIVDVDRTVFLRFNADLAILNELRWRESVQHFLYQQFGLGSDSVENIRIFAGSVYAKVAFWTSSDADKVRDKLEDSYMFLHMGDESFICTIVDISGGADIRTTLATNVLVTGSMDRGIPPDLASKRSVDNGAMPGAMVLLGAGTLGFALLVLCSVAICTYMRRRKESKMIKQHPYALDLDFDEFDGDAGFGANISVKHDALSQVSLSEQGEWSIDYGDSELRTIRRPYNLLLNTFAPLSSAAGSEGGFASAEEYQLFKQNHFDAMKRSGGSQWSHARTEQQTARLTSFCSSTDRPQQSPRRLPSRYNPNTFTKFSFASEADVTAVSAVFANSESCANVHETPSDAVFEIAVGGSEHLTADVDQLAYELNEGYELATSHSPFSLSPCEGYELDSSEPYGHPDSDNASACGDHLATTAGLLANALDQGAIEGVRNILANGDLRLKGAVQEATTSNIQSLLKAIPKGRTSMKGTVVLEVDPALPEGPLKTIKNNSWDTMMIQRMGLCNGHEQETFENDYRAALEAARLNKRP